MVVAKRTINNQLTLLAEGTDHTGACLSEVPAAIRRSRAVAGGSTALAAATPVLVSGDADLLALNDEVPSLQIINLADFKFWLVAHR